MPNKNTSLLTYILNYKKLVIAAIFYTLIAVTTNLLGPLLIGNTIDYMVGPNQVAFIPILKLLILIGITYLLHSIGLWLLTLSTNKIAYRTANTLRKQLFSKLEKLALKFYDTVPHGNTMGRFTSDVDTIADGLQQSISVFLIGIMTVLGAIGFMLSIHPLMAVLVILSAPLSYYVAKFISKKSQQYFKRQANLVGELNGYAEEVLSNQKLIQTFCYEDTSIKNFKNLNQNLYEIGVKAQFYSSLTNPSTRVVNNITYAVIGIIGALAAVKGTLSIGNISSFLLYATIFSKPFNEITGVIPQLQAANASLTRIFDLLNTAEEKPETTTLSTLSDCKGAIRFLDVCFSYSKEKPLISHFNLTVTPGSRVAIVGTTGAGKTTLINLLMRFYDIDSGDIQIDDTSIYDLSRDSLRHSFGMVLQDTWLFNGTIFENICYGKPSATKEEVIAVAKASGLHSFIRKLPIGYDTPLSDAGSNLSEGQKQLLTITRVMLQDPSMLLLDEATSNMDTLTELNIQKAFLKMMEGRTSFIIAHRLSTIKDADIILVMEKGNVVENGNHQSLLRKEGAYSKLYHSQFL